MKETAKLMVADWIKEHVNYQSDFCLVFPFYRDPNGYGMLNWNGRHSYAHRVMCELVNGPPGDGLEAAHECGNGDGGCCNPRHLKWKTKAENRQDTFRHGTDVRNTNGNRRRLSEVQIMEIRELKGHKTQRELAEQFGISPPMVRAIFSGAVYAAKSKVNHFTPEEDAQILALANQGKNYSQIGRVLGRDSGSVGTRAKKLGAQMNYKPWPKGTKTTDLPLT